MFGVDLGSNIWFNTIPFLRNPVLGRFLALGWRPLKVLAGRKKPRHEGVF